MKLFTKLFILSAAVTALSSCRGDLLDTVPYDKAASNSMWSNEPKIRNYHPIHD